MLRGFKMKGKLIVTWDSHVDVVESSVLLGEGVVLKRSLWKEQEFPIDVFEAARLQGAFEGHGPWDSDGEDGCILEDRAGDLFFSRDEVLDVWEEYLKDSKVEDKDYEQADEPMAVIDFAKWVKSLPEKAFVEVNIIPEND
jgi:hypothetical protein